MATNRQNKSDSNRASNRGGFTLVELLVVLAIMAVLASLVVSAFNSIGDSQNFGSEVSDLQQTLDDARSYAMANNTFVFVGLEEVDASQSTTASPQNLETGTTSGAAGNGGRLAVAVVTTKDGTNALGTNNSNVTALNKLRVFSNVHMTPDYYMGTGRKSSSNISATSPSSLANRAIVNRACNLGYQANTAATASSGGLPEYFTWPLSSATAQYSFNRIIQYSPDGSASLVHPLPTTQLTYTPQWLEIDLEEMHGYSLSAVTHYTGLGSLNKAVAGHQVAAIQIDGITGNSQLYQQ